MTRLAQTADLTDIQQEILSTVRTFVDKEIIPHAQELEHADAYPQEIVDGLKDLGIFGLTIPEEYGGLGESLLTYALVVEEIARGWMSVSGVINTHFIVAYMVMQHGTAEQRERLLPRMATGEVRGAFSMSEPGLGSDVAGIRTRAVQQADGGYVIDGQKMWLTNGGSSTLVAALVRTTRAPRRPPEPDDLPGREAGRLRRGRPRAHHPRQDRQDGLQGRRHHRAGVRRLPAEAEDILGGVPGRASPR
jgi:alkylation response protein AidB-like acyl-CoA dehydrogenase